MASYCATRGCYCTTGGCIAQLEDVLHNWRSILHNPMSLLQLTLTQSIPACKASVLRNFPVSEMSLYIELQEARTGK